MAWLVRIAGLPSRTLIRSAGVAAMGGIAGLGVGIGSGCTPLLAAAYAVIFLAALVPAARAEVTPDGQWMGPEGGQRVWIEPQRHRLH